MRVISDWIKGYGNECLIPFNENCIVNWDKNKQKEENQYE